MKNLAVRYVDFARISNSKTFQTIKTFNSGTTEDEILSWAEGILERNKYEIYLICTKNIVDSTIKQSYSSGFLLHNVETCSLIIVDYTTSNILVNSKKRNSNWTGWKTK